MAGIAKPNLPQYYINDAAVTARNAQYTGDPLTDDAGDGTYNTYQGCNRAGSNSPGIGISTGEVTTPVGEAENPEKWTVLDQNGNPRTPQDSQHIGGNGIEEGSPTGYNPVQFMQAPDVNDQAYMVVTDTAAADGAIMDTVTGTVNETGAAVAVGDRVWGVLPVV